MATGSIFEIATKITSHIFCEAIVSALKRVFVDRVMLQDEAHHQQNIIVQEANKKFIEIDLAMF